MSAIKQLGLFLNCLRPPPFSGFSSNHASLSPQWCEQLPCQIHRGGPTWSVNRGQKEVIPENLALLPW